MPDLIGQILSNRYRIDASIGRGGMAEVYKVWDQRRAAYLAMKILNEDLAEDNVFLRRFKREAQTLARLQHPNIVRFYGLEEDGDLAFLLMDYIEGSTLRKEIHRLKGQPFPVQRILEIMRPVCSALHYAHQSGFVHCDVKPANIMIQTNGTVLVSDFGIARMSEAATATLVGAGTPAYMAPEQARGEDPTPQTDIYALGVVLFEMLTGGERPFTGENARTTGGTSEKIRWEQMKLEPPSPRKYNPAISPQLEEIVLRCLNKNPAARYSNTLELLTALDAAVGASQIKAVQSVVQNVALPKVSPAPQPQVSQEKNQGQAIPLPKKPHRAARKVTNSVQEKSQSQTTADTKTSHRTAWIVTGSILLIAVILVGGAISISNSGSQQLQFNSQNTAQANATTTAQIQATNEAVVQAPNGAETTTAQVGLWRTEAAQANATSLAVTTGTPLPISLITPTVTPTGLCYPWSQITSTMLGKEVCVYGNVYIQRTMSYGGSRIFFDENQSFFLVSSDVWFPTVNKGDCVSGDGEVEQSTDGILYINIKGSLHYCAPSESFPATPNITQLETATASVANRKLIYGPQAGTLPSSTDKIPEYPVDVNLQDFMLDMTFINPYSASTGSWDYGFYFRYTSNEVYAIVLMSNKGWILTDNTNNGSKTVISGTIPSLNVNAGESNKISFICSGTQGLLYVNDNFISILDLSNLTSTGSITLGSGFYSGDAIAGYSTSFKDLSVWTIP